MTSPALLTDLYELTMAAAYVAEDMAERSATFSLFVRHLPHDRGYLVAAGLEPVLGFLESFRFSDEDLGALDDLGRFGPEVLDRLAELRFTGRVRALPEGTLVFPDEPILEIDGPMIEAQLVETLVLNQVTLHTTLASKAARFRTAAGDHTVADFGLRRAQGTEAGMAVARSARLVGLAGTSNVAGGLAYDLALSGTMAHSFVSAYVDEAEAFRAYARVHGDGSVLLVDTHDTLTGVARAIDVGLERSESGGTIRAIRLDSGDLATLAREARRMLDDAGLHAVQILASGGLDEDDIERLVEGGVPIDGFGVGSSLAVSADAPVVDSVYKLVCFDNRPVRKTSEGKVTWPGPKQVWRTDDWSGDTLGLWDEHDGLLVEVMVDGERTEGAEDATDLASAAGRFDRQLAGLPGDVSRLRSPVAYPVEVSPALRALTDTLQPWRSTTT